MSTPLLPEVDGPHSIQKLTFKELEQLAKEIRNRIISVLSVTGGHLGSNLGTVELTLALHKVFDSPTDKFIWDVSHQTYTHKLVTGRNDQFDTLRQYQGICGFSHRRESPHDHFHAGHAGTALSLALGAAKSRDLAGGSEHIIPIIGDATLTCGMSLEALNNLPPGLKRYVVVLNDNRMSISQNVGAITNILSRMLSNPTTHRIYHEINQFISKIPSMGTLLSKQGKKLTESMKNLVSPAVFFEEYGLFYIGPIDGHDIKKLTETFEGVKEARSPVLIHILSNKGEGMEAALQNPVSYHGVKPFDPNTGKMYPATSSKPTFPKVFGSQIVKMAETDPDLVVVTPAMTAGSQLESMKKQFPDRCVDGGIAEPHIVTYAGGLASQNTRVIVSIYATFLQRALDNLFHDVCIQEFPVVFCIDRAGLSGPDGVTHHGIYDLSFLNAMPNMIIAQPRDGSVLKELMTSAFSWGQPAAIRYPNLLTDVSKTPLKVRTPGKGEILRKGKDLLIVALGHMNECALEVSSQLEDLGIYPTVFDPVFVKPLDCDLLHTLLLEHTHIVTLEEHSVQSGLGSILNHFLMTNGYQATKVLNFGIPEVFLQHGSRQKLLESIDLSSHQVTKKIVKHFQFENGNRTKFYETISPSKST